MHARRILRDVGDYSSLRVSRETQDAVNRVAQRLGVSADRAIGVALAALKDQEWRRQASEHARRMAASSGDRAEVAAAIRDLTGDDAG
jgi:hypothetical protein